MIFFFLRNRIEEVEFHHPVGDRREPPRLEADGLRVAGFGGRDRDQRIGARRALTAQGADTDQQQYCDDRKAGNKHATSEMGHARDQEVNGHGSEQYLQRFGPQA